MIDFRVNLHFSLGTCALVEHCLWKGFNSDRPQIKRCVANVMHLVVCAGKCAIEHKHVAIFFSDVSFASPQ